MVLPKQVAYVGEMIPVQIRLGLNMRAPVDSLGSGMQIAGQGFTTQKMPEPRQTIENINGRSYQVFIFKTAISPVRAGKLEIGPAEINPVVRVSRGGQRNPSLPRDLVRRSVLQQLLQRSRVRAIRAEGDQPEERGDRRLR